MGEEKSVFAINQGQVMNEPCPRCGKQPVVTKGSTYWSAHCLGPRLLRTFGATPMRTKTAALQAWNDGLKSKVIS